MEQTRLKVYLGLYGFHDFDQLSDPIRAKADKLFLKGDVLPNTENKVSAKESMWRLYSKLDPHNLSLEEHVSDIIRSLPEDPESLKEYLDYELIMSCIAECYDNTPILGLSSKAMRYLSDIKCDLDIDLYCLGSN